MNVCRITNGRIVAPHSSTASGQKVFFENACTYTLVVPIGDILLERADILGDAGINGNIERRVAGHTKKCFGPIDGPIAFPGDSRLAVPGNDLHPFGRPGFKGKTSRIDEAKRPLRTVSEQYGTAYHLSVKVHVCFT